MYYKIPSWNLQKTSMLASRTSLLIEDVNKRSHRAFCLWQFIDLLRCEFIAVVLEECSAHNKKGFTPELFLEDKIPFLQCLQVFSGSDGAF